MDLKVAIFLTLACVCSSAETCGPKLLQCQTSFANSTGDALQTSIYYGCVSSVVCDVNSIEYAQQQQTLSLLAKEIQNIESLGPGFSSAPVTITTSFPVIAASFFVYKMLAARRWS